MDETSKKVIMHVQSSQNRILIKNGLVANHDSSRHVDVFVEDSIIKQVGNHLIIPGGTRVIDATGKWVIPGGIDPNVHFQTPIDTSGTMAPNGTRTLDDFYAGTKAAIAGGTTTIIDTVSPSPDESLIQAFEKWQAWAEEKACCDFAFKMRIPTPLNEDLEDQMRELSMENNINCFLASMEEFNDADLINFYQACASSGSLAQVHAESPECVKRNERNLLKQGIVGPEGYIMSHTEEAEEEATLRACTLANQMNCPLYLSHISSTSTVEIVSAKKKKGHVVYAEVSPAALAGDGEAYWDKDWKKAAASVTSPPIRKEQNQGLIEKLVEEDTGLDLVGSNHAAFNANQKALGQTDFTKIPVGANGVQERMMVVHDKCKMTPERFVAATSSNAAKIFGLYPDKGRIDEGSQADIVIWDPAATTQISTDAQISKSDLNIFEGMDFKGKAETVILRGRIVLDEDNLKVLQGYGRFLPLSPYPAHVYEKIKAREDNMFNFHPVERKDEDILINGDIPPPAPAISFQPEKAASQHISNFDLKLHPNEDEAEAEPVVHVLARHKHRSSIRIRNPPGGQTSGSFW